MGGKAGIWLAGVAGLVVIGVYLYFQNQAEQERMREAIQAQLAHPVNEMILKDHPKSRKRIEAHFTRAYETGGPKSFPDAQLELQQIFNVNFLVDRAWYVDDAVLRDNLMREYAFLRALHDKTRPQAKETGGKKTQAPARKGKPGLCEKYLQNSANFAAAKQAAGKDLFNGYMKSSEKLFLSAKNKGLYPMWPGAEGYTEALRLAQMDFLRVLIALNPDLADLKDAVANKNALPCETVLLLEYALLQINPAYMSLLWRAGMEADRARVIALRKKNGLE